MPVDVTRVLPTTHCAVTHGGTDGGMPAHPATTHGLGSWHVGMPLTVTRGLGTVA
jgi:hypothetical protein